MRTVFPNAMVAHVWAQQRQDEGRSSNGNFWFEGDTLYSYRTPIARIVTDQHGREVMLITTESYSVTTAGHKSDARRAARGIVFHVPFIGATGGRAKDSADMAQVHRGNLDYLQAEYETLKGKALRARSWYGSLDERLADYVEHAAKYAHAFGLPYEAPNYERDADEIMKRREEREARLNTPEAIAKRQREAERREQRKAEREAEARRIAMMRDSEKREAYRQYEGER